MSETVGEKRPTGRTQLKGVLDGLVQQSKDERNGGDEEIVVDDDVEEAARDLLELPHRTGYEDGIRKRGRGRKRKRSRKDYLNSSYDGGYPLEENGERHRPYVMTLFDRKVDLAKFTPSTPLYVMCRDWMCNNPKRVGRHHQNGITVATGLVDGGSGTEVPQSEDGHDPLTARLPPPRPLPTDETGHVIRMDIPSPTPPEGSKEDLDRSLHKVSGGQGEADRVEVKRFREEHVKRWKTTRTKWKRASSVNQQRYVESLQLLRDMYHR